MRSSRSGRWRSTPNWGRSGYTVLKVISLMRPKNGLSYEEFKQWALEEPSERGHKPHGHRHYRMCVVNIDSPDVPAVVVSELWFADEAARQAAFATEEG